MLLLYGSHINVTYMCCHCYMDCSYKCHLLSLLYGHKSFHLLSLLYGHKSFHLLSLLYGHKSFHLLSLLYGHTSFHLLSLLYGHKSFHLLLLLHGFHIHLFTYCYCYTDFIYIFSPIVIATRISYTSFHLLLLLYGQFLLPIFVATRVFIAALISVALSVEMSSARWHRYSECAAIRASNLECRTPSIISMLPIVSSPCSIPRSSRVSWTSFAFRGVYVRLEKMIENLSNSKNYVNVYPLWFKVIKICTYNL